MHTSAVLMCTRIVSQSLVWRTLCPFSPSMLTAAFACMDTAMPVSLKLHAPGRQPTSCLCLWASFWPVPGQWPRLEQTTLWAWSAAVLLRSAGSCREGAEATGAHCQDACHCLLVLCYLIMLKTWWSRLRHHDHAWDMMITHETWWSRMRHDDHTWDSMITLKTCTQGI